MAKSSIDLLALNREILLNPLAASNNELVALLELEQPGLEFLCPMARAIYWIANNRQGHINANEVLGSLWLVDDSEAQGTGCHGEYADVTESVQHSIVVRCGEAEIKLGFESSSELVYCGAYWPEWVRCVNALDVAADLTSDHCCLIDQWFDRLDGVTKDTRVRRTPNGYPTDSGEFIGTCCYTLTSVNGMPVEGPTYSDTYHETEWEGLHEDYLQRCDEEPSCFCWLHYLSCEQAEQIGIAAKGKKVQGSSEIYPEWVPKSVITQRDGLWINSDQIQSSYSQGTVIVKPSTEAWLAVGCGPEWNPIDHPDDQTDPEDGDWEQYPSNAGPVIRIELSRDEKGPPPELAVLLPYIQRLRPLST